MCQPTQTSQCLHHPAPKAMEYYPSACKPQPLLTREWFFLPRLCTVDIKSHCFSFPLPPSEGAHWLWPRARRFQLRLPAQLGWRCCSPPALWVFGSSTSSFSWRQSRSLVRACCSTGAPAAPLVLGSEAAKEIKIKATTGAEHIAPALRLVAA